MKGYEQFLLGHPFMGNPAQVDTCIYDGWDDRGFAKCGKGRNKHYPELPPAPATPIVSHTKDCKHDCRYPHGFWCECRCHEFEIRNEVVVRQPSTFNTILDEMRSVHDKKSADYAKSDDRYSNFTEAASEAGCSVDTVFRVLIGIKNSRIKQLMNSGVSPKNESLEDSLLDRTVYSVLWMAWRRENEK